MSLASSVKLDWNEGVTIDGIEFPFYVGEDVTVEAGHDMITTINLDLLVMGVVTLTDRHGARKVYDEREGDVAEWARRLVREGLVERIPDLVLPEPTHERQPPPPPLPLRLATEDARGARRLVGCGGGVDE